MEVEFFYVQCMYNILVSLHVSSSHEKLFNLCNYSLNQGNYSFMPYYCAFNSHIVSNHCSELFSKPYNFKFDDYQSLIRWLSVCSCAGREKESEWKTKVWRGSTAE